ncbi:exonuclease SbcCD subunit D [Lacticaseibacillus saniviri]|uniref:Nuclease SbcCD subunit D n=1 Tax=Lacticaseibacillus saniviri JCM 17471 = DSM 24301 TaxID=1293598 RepID=A0A0R2MPE7_9LACO|nr:exonuclease SbcCD subunit D [Lacticaseibacillus saniviri]KRO15524.1 DNA repair exonuclease [Lacticaseibacillus saniviri JCM 17471 = DSM 24301]MCG4281957.1 exonuclease SbcCD subunit D [Lacticaseibacillus saniviri]
MRFLHTADWHIGKKLAGFDLIEDQRAVFEQVKQIARDQAVDAIVVAGDLYDRALPSEAAVTTVNEMLVELNRDLALPVLAISGNHDSAVRLATGREWYQATQLYLNTQLSEAFTSVTIDDTQFFLLPYFEPFAARQYFDDDKLTNINGAMPRVVAEMVAQFEPDKRHVLVAHFFAAGSSHSDSETLVNVGGLDSVAVDDLAPFDYVALGHLHNRHALNMDRIQYAGSLLKYSVSEANQDKGVYIVDTETMTREFIPVVPEHDVKTVTASFETLLSSDYRQTMNTDDYLAVTLTDVQVIPNVMQKLREVYPRIIGLGRKQQVAIASQLTVTKRHLAPMTLLAELFEEQMDQPLSAQQQKWAERALRAAKEAD